MVQNANQQYRERLTGMLVILGIEEILTITKEPENEAAGGGNLVVLRHDDGSMFPFELS